MQGRSTTKKTAGCVAFAAAATIALGASPASAQDPPPPPPGFEGQAPPPTYYVPQTVAMSGPRIINDWEEGQPIPAGYHPSTRIRKGLVIAGAVTFGVMYIFGGLLPAAILSDTCGCGQGLFVPIAGPFIYIPEIGSATAGVFLAIDGLAQAAGAAMLIAGIAAPKTVLVRNDLGKGTIMPMPMKLGKSGAGFGLVGTF